MRSLLDALEATQLRERNPGLMAAAEGVLAYGGADKRAGDLYGSSGNILLKARALVKGLQASAGGGVRGMCAHQHIQQPRSRAIVSTVHCSPTSHVCIRPQPHLDHTSPT